MGWVTALVVGVVLWLLRDNDRERFKWRELSLAARLREAQTRIEVLEKVIVRLKSDYAAGKLTINDEYRSLFERLTADVRAGDAGETS